MIDIHPHDHWYAPRPRENGDVARGTASAQYQPAVSPISSQKRRRRHVVCRDDHSWWHDLFGFACQIPQHAIAKVAQVGSTRAEIRIAGLLIGGDLWIDRVAPRPTSDLSRGDERD